MSFTSDYKARHGLPMNSRQKREAEKTDTRVSSTYNSSAVSQLLSIRKREQTPSVSGFKEWSAATLAAKRAEKIRESFSQQTSTSGAETDLSQLTSQAETASDYQTRLDALKAKKRELEAGLALDQAASLQPEITELERKLGQTIPQRVVSTASGALKQMAGGYSSFLTSLYESGQGVRDAQNEDFLQEQQTRLERAQREYDAMVAANKKKPGTWSEGDLESAQNVIEDAKLKLSAAKKIVTEKVQQKATQSAHKFSEEISASGSADLEKAKKDLDPVSSFLVDAGAAGLQMLGDAAIGGGLGWSALPSMFVRSAGGGVQEARAGGASTKQQILYGAASGALSVATEKISNVAGPFKKMFGEGVLDSAIDRAVGRLGNTAAGNLIASAISEGSEEFIESVFQPVLQRAIYDPDAKFDLGEALYEAAVGGVLGLLGGGVELASQTAGTTETAQAKKAVTAEKSVSEAVDKAVSSPYNENVETEAATVLNQGATLYAQLGMKVKRAEAKATVVQKLVDGETVTTGELKSLNLTDPQYRNIFTELTGIQFPQGKVTEEQLFNLARSAKGVTTPAQAAAQTRAAAPQASSAGVSVDPGVTAPGTTSAPQTQAQQSRTAPATLEEYSQAYRARVNPEATDSEIQQSYDQYAREMQTVRTAHNGTLTRSEFKQIMRNSAQGSQYTDEQLDRVFDAALRQQEGNAEAGALFRAGDGGTVNERSESDVRGEQGQQVNGVSERRADFVRRCTEEGYEIVSGPNSDYAIRRLRVLSDGRASTEAQEAQKELEVLGVPCIVKEGPVAKNTGDTTVELPVSQSTTLGGAIVAVDSQLSLSGRNVAGHEAFHYWGDNDTRTTYVETVRDNLNFSSQVFQDYQSEISKALFNQEVDLDNEEQSRIYNEELFAYISGDIHEGTNDDRLRPMFVNYDEVKDAWRGLVSANSGANTRQEDLANEQQTERIGNQEQGTGRRSTEEGYGQISEDTLGRQDGRLRVLPDGQTSATPQTTQRARGEVAAEAETDLARMQKMSWSDQVSNRDSLPENSALYLRETPYLLSEVGLGDLPMCMTVKHLNDVMHEKSEENTRWHGIDQDVIERLPELISKPAMIMDSNSRRGDIMVVTTEVDSDGNPIVVSIRPNGTAMVGGVRGPANFITSVYGRENFAVKRGRNSLNNLMYLATKNRLVLYWNKEKTEALFRDTGLRLPGGLNSVPSDTILKQHAGYVKENIPERLFRVEEESDEVLLSDDSRGAGGVQEAGRGADGSVSERGLGDRNRTRRGNADDSAQLAREGAGERGSQETGGLRQPQTASYPGGREGFGRPGVRTADRGASGSGGRNSGPQQNRGSAGRGELGTNQEGTEPGVIPGAATSEATTADGQDGASFVLDLPDFKSWDDAFLHLERANLGLTLGDPPQMALASGDKMDLGYSDPDGKWVSVKTFPLTPRGLSEFKRQLPTLLQAVDPQPKARPWADTVKTSKVAYPMKDGTTVEVTTVSAADVGLTKAEKDARRVGMQLVPALGSLPENRSTAGITIARTRQIFSVVEDPKLGTNRRTADHEVLHAYALADHELQFQILDAIRDAGLDSQFDALYNRAMNLWAGRYQEADPVTLQYQIEQEVMAEARAGNTNLLGRDIKKIGPTVRQTVRAWEKNWDKAHKGADPQDVRLSQPNAMDLALRYRERGGFRDGTLDPGEDIDFSMFDETDAYDRYSLPQLVDPMYSKLAREVQNFKGEKIGAASAVSYLKGKGVKAEEIKWSGIEAFLDGKKSVTKEELLQYLRDNALRIETETLSGEGGFRDRISGKMFPDMESAKKEAERIAANMGFSASDVLMDSFDGGNRVEFYIPGGDDIDLVKVERVGGTARWAEYKLPGGDKYREILFKIPGSTYSNYAMSVHWNEHGVLAHARVQDMAAADGGKVLFVEEIQSDWHNAGRQYGYVSEGDQARYYAKMQEVQERKSALQKELAEGDLHPLLRTFAQLKTGGDESRASSYFSSGWGGMDYFKVVSDGLSKGQNPHNYPIESEEWGRLNLSRDGVSLLMKDVDRLDEWKTRWNQQVLEEMEVQQGDPTRGNGLAPDAPFSKNYHEYVMKNLLREAAENGYDYVAWTTGKTQEDRWSSDYAEGYRIEYDQDIPKFMNKYGKQWGAKVEDIVVGGDLSRSGAFQDGGMAEVVRIANGENFTNERYNVAHAVAVNDAMRDSVLYEGQPMFQVKETQEQEQFRTEFDAVYGDGAAADLLANVRGALAEASAQQPESESQVGWVMYGKKPEAQSVGAAALRFDPYSYLQNEYGTIPQTGTNYRVADVPKSTTGRDKVMKTASTVMGAEATPEARLGTIAQAVVDGKLSYVPITNKILNNQTRAKIRKQGYNAVLSDWTRQVEQGEVNAKIVATGATLLNNAGNSDMDGRTYTELLVDYANVLHRAGQALQAARLLKTLSPEAKLYEVIREVDRVNRKAFPDANVPVGLWMDRAGGLLADKLIERISTKAGKDKARTVVDTILDDLYRRAGEMVEKSPAPARRARTEMERLQDMFDNYANYKEAWDAAKETIRAEYADDPAVLEALDEWLSDSLTLAKPLTKELMRGVEVTMSEELAEKYLAAKSDAERDAVMDEILQDIADQIPATWGDKFTAWRYLAMLGNLRTQVRNIVGNTAMQPLRITKETFSGLTEALLQRAGAKIDRTTSALYDVETFKAAFQDYNEVRDVILSGGKYDDSRKYSAEIESKRRIFKNALLEGYRKATNTAMDVGDSIFCSFTYADSLARFMKANGTTWSQADEALRDKARTKAIRDAAEATYRDNNALSELVSRARIRDPKNALAKAAQVMIEGTLPFRKTPANILVRSFEYSPLGILDTAFKTAQLARGAGEVTANDIIDSASKALAGTSLVALGFAWAAMGVLKGKAPDDEKEKELWEMQGHQAYSLEVGGTSYTLDWLAPSSIPMFFGANLQEAMLGEGLTVEDATSAFGSLFDPILEMSMLQGINDTLESAANYGTVAAAVRLPANAAWNYLTQFVPTLAGQAARSLETDRMTTYADKNNVIPDDLERKIGNLSGKIPGWDYARITYIDSWGRTEPNADTATLNALNQFFSPGYYSQVRETDMEKELLRLYETTGETSVLISKPSKYLTVNEERKDLTADEYLTYAVTRGQAAFSLATDLTSSAAYKSMTDAQKVKAMEKVYDYADQTAKEQLLGKDFAADKWVYNARSAEADLGISVDTYLAAYTMLKDVPGVKNHKEDTVKDSIALRSMQMLYDIPDLSEEQVRGLAALLGVAESVQGYSSKMVDRKLDALEKKYSKYN